MEIARLMAAGTFTSEQTQRDSDGYPLPLDFPYDSAATENR
jgi:hypothetical protein